jgi:molecular chaperone GrpE (heat shock protein)
MPIAVCHSAFIRRIDKMTQRFSTKRISIVQHQSIELSYVKSVYILERDRSNRIRTGACHDFEPFRPSLEKVYPAIIEDPWMNWHSEMEAVYTAKEMYKQFNYCLFVIPPTTKSSSIDIIKVRNSVEFIKNVSSKMIGVINTLDMDGTISEISLDHKQLADVKEKFVGSKAIAEDIQNEISDTMQPDEATAECANYHRSLLDMEFGSGILKGLAAEIDKGFNPQEKKFWEKLEGILKIIRKKVEQVVERLKGLISHLCRYMIGTLDAFKEALKKGENAIINAFTSLAERFLDLIENLMEQMFKFLTQFGSIAKSKGFQLSKIDIRIPSVKFESVILFMVSIPLPKIESPEIMLSIESGKK